MVPLSLFYVATVALFVVAAAVSDLRTRKLPNWLTVPVFAAAVILHTAVNGLAGLGFALLGFATGFGILLVLWLIGGGGGGDVKLMGALGACLGARLTLAVFLVSAALAAVATAAVLVSGMLSRGAGFARRFLASGSASQRRHTSRGKSRGGPGGTRQRLMPFAVPVAGGTLLVLAYAWKSAILPW